MQTYRGCSDIQRVFRHTEGVQTYRGCSDIQRVYRHTEGVQTYRGCFSFLHRAQLSVLLALVAKDTIGPGLLGGTCLGR